MTDEPAFQPRRYTISTPAGAASLVFDKSIRNSPRPLVVLFHGAFRSAIFLDSWFERLAPLADVVICELPGHGKAQRITPTLETYSRLFESALTMRFHGRRMVLVGESLGGLVAASLSHLGPVVALDPPLSTAKLWPLHLTIRRRREEDPTFNFDAEFVSNFFGYRDDGPPVQRSYFNLFEKLASPAWVVAGGVPLSPPRFVQTTPGFLESPDLDRLRKLPGVTVSVAPEAGHLITSEAPECALSAIGEALSSLGMRTAS